MRVLFLETDAPVQEECAALAWLRGRENVIFDTARATSIAPGDARLAEADVVWLHAADRVPELSAPAIAALRDRVLQRGGGLLLTLLATPLVTALGLEPLPPNDVGVSVWHHDADPLWTDAFRDWPDYPHVRGMQGWGRHPLFDDLGRGTFTWRATEGERVAGATYVAPRLPRGRVIAVDRAYVALDADRAIAWEYTLGGGRVLCIGAHLLFAAPDRSLSAQRDLVAANALRLLGRRAPVAESWWPDRGAPLLPLGDGAVPPGRFGPRLPASADPITLTSLARDDDPFTLAGRRALAVGAERSGLAEVWVHPMCVLSGGIDIRIDGEEPAVRSVELSPTQVVRHLHTRSRFVEEHLFVAHDIGAVVLEYRWRRLGGSRAELDAPRLELRFRAPLRLEWPIPADALRPLRVASMAGGDATAVSVIGRDDRFRALVNVEGRAAVTVHEDDAAPRLVVAGSLGECLRVSWVGGIAGRAGIARAVRAIERAGVRELAARRLAHQAALREERFSLRSPSASLDTAIEWAKVRLDSFVATTPGVGTGLMAGYAATRPGWGESRPGFAWYFGRDACWSALALLAAGEFASARAALEFLGAWQDITGKIPHEVTTSGAVHYDAADATPLWLYLAARYAAWSGDADTVRALWPRVRLALDYVRSTDRDGDGLPENTGIGHGWIEQGPLGGGAVTSYVAAIWIRALESVGALAAVMGDAEVEARCAADARRARRAFDDRLLDPDTGLHALHIDAAGARLAELTALSAVPIALGVVAPARAAHALDALDAAALAAPWGVRMLPADHPLFRPTAYHAGAVWPLYTGWMALAEFHAHRAEQGLRALMANALLCYDRAKGAFDEVLHGTELRGAGVCPDQAWSAAMVLLPVVDGLLGARPDAMRRRIELTPHWPREWTGATVRHLRVGDASLDLEATEGCLVRGVPHDGVAYRLRATPAGALTVVLEHPVGGRRVHRVLVDGEEVETVRCGTPECPHVRATLWLAGASEVQFVGDPIGAR